MKNLDKVLTWRWSIDSSCTPFLWSFGSIFKSGNYSLGKKWVYPVIYNLYFNLFQRGEASAHPNQFPLTVYSVSSLFFFFFFNFFYPCINWMWYLISVPLIVQLKKVHHKLHGEGTTKVKSLQGTGIWERRVIIDKEEW